MPLARGAVHRRRGRMSERHRADDSRRGRRRRCAAVGDWIALLKPRVMSLVVFTGLIGLLVAPGHLHPVLAVTAVLCIAVGAGAAARSTCGTTATSTR